MSAAPFFPKTLELIKASPTKRVLCSDMLNQLMKEGAQSRRWIKSHVLKPLQVRGEIATLASATPIRAHPNDKVKKPDFYWYEAARERILRKDKEALKAEKAGAIGGPKEA